MDIKQLSKNEKLAVEEFKNILLREFPEKIEMIKLYGSKARGDYHQESDIDIFILVNITDSKASVKNRLFKKIDVHISDIAFDLLLKYEVLLSPITMDKEHFSYLKYLQTGYVKNIEKEGIALWKAH